MLIEERPREKAINSGLSSLTNKELLALLIRSGSKGESVLEVSQAVLRLRKNLAALQTLTLAELIQVRGIKEAKALELLACIELSKRMAKEPILYQDVLKSPNDVMQWLNKEIGFSEQEHFYVIFLNNKNQIIEAKPLFIGSSQSCQVSPKQVFHLAIRNNSSKIILAHNHPSGDTRPSEADIELTKCLVDLAGLCGIVIVDHLIVGQNQYYSFAANHQIPSLIDS